MMEFEPLQEREIPFLAGSATTSSFVSDLESSPGPPACGDRAPAGSSFLNPDETSSPKTNNSAPRLPAIVPSKFPAVSAFFLSNDGR
jgi:hypothetical protein